MANIQNNQIYRLPCQKYNELSINRTIIKCQTYTILCRKDLSSTGIQPSGELIYCVIGARFYPPLVYNHHKPFFWQVPWTHSPSKQILKNSYIEKRKFIACFSAPTWGKRRHLHKTTFNWIHEKLPCVSRFFLNKYI